MSDRQVPLFGTRLRAFRVAAGLSQEALADRARISAKAISALERGARRAPYRATLVALATALGLKPSEEAELEALRTARTQRCTAREHLAVRPALLAPRTNLPFDVTPLVGREVELAEISRLLSRERLVTITGPGGVGKTRTAIAIGRALVDATQAEVWLVELASVSQPSQVAVAIAGVLTIRTTSSDGLPNALIAHLKQKSVVLIIDNCEHVIVDAARLTDALLRACPHLRIVVTSREPLRILGENIYWLPSLAVPTEQEAAALTVDAVHSFAAMALFVERAHASDNGFILSDDSVALIAAICRRLDGIPLAIELAAARVKALSLTRLSRKLDRRLEILANGYRTAPPRHQTIRALIAWSYDLLTPPEQRLLECLSIFVGGFTLQAATAVSADDEDDVRVSALLSSLIDKSLVVADAQGSEPRYRLLELSRQYARERLNEHGDSTLVAQRHAAAYVDFAERLDRDYHIGTDLAWFVRLKRDFDNCRAALEWTLGARADVQLGLRLARSMVPAWLYLSPAEGRRWLRAAISMADERTPGRLVAELERVAALIAWVSGDFEAALTGSRRAFLGCTRHIDVIGAARAQWLVGSSLVNLGSFAEGEQVLRTVIDAAHTLEMPRLVGLALEGIAKARCMQGDVDAARRFVTDALALYDRFSAVKSETAIGLFAEIEFVAGNVERAVELRTMSLNSSAPFPFWLGKSHADLAMYLIACDQWIEAKLHALEALQLAQVEQSQVNFVWTMQHIAAINALRPRSHGEKTISKAEMSALLVGYVNSRSIALGASRPYAERQEYDRLLTALRTKMNEAQLASLFTSGARLPRDEAIQLAHQA